MLSPYNCWYRARCRLRLVLLLALSGSLAFATACNPNKLIADEAIGGDANALNSFKTYCFDCHIGKEAEGGIRVDILGENADFENSIETIEKIILVLEEQQMPPADAEQPETADRLAMLTWIESRLQEFDCGSASRPGRVTLRRLNRPEYNNTIRDLTGLDLHLADQFPSDDVGNGFDNIGDVLSLPPILMEKYIAAATETARAVVDDEQALLRVFPLTPGNPERLEEVAEVAKANAADFARRAFRRELRSDEIDRLAELLRATWQSGASKPEILQTVITAVLASPHFIFRIEDDDPKDFEDGIRPLNDYELATRLSYFLWSSMPDERLFTLAREGKLHTAEQLTSEARRMLTDPKSQALVSNFAGQWLQLRDLKQLSPDPVQFASFDEKLRNSMRQETELLFKAIVTESRSILELLNADYSFIDGRLAEHYGMEGIEGDEFQRVAMVGQRRGVLMHASILLITSNPNRTSPVKRGKWVMDNLLGEPPPPPPPGVPLLDESGESLGSLRQQMEQHRANPNCAVCHTKMDALGFGLENFDAIGQWRDADGKDVIDASGTLPGDREFHGPVELVEILAEQKKTEFARCMSKKLLTYALGRGLAVHDRCCVSDIVHQLENNNYSFGTLIDAIVTSPPFMTQESGR